ncbi:MAG: hypothetical protein QNJ44_22540 [Rhodobacter sp.]|nr:hypothetical protein [Rhodobacter sp.]
MRRLLLAALLSTTALVPARADAGPVLGFISALSGGTLFAGSYFAPGFLGGYTAGSLLGSSVLGRLALGLGVSALSSAVFQPDGPKPTDRLVNYAQPIAFMERGYGTVRKGGPLSLSKFAGKKRHYGVLMAAQSTEGVVEHWLDDTADVQLDGSGNVTDAPYAGYGNIRPFTGQSGQTADSLLVSTFTQFTASHDFAELSGAWLWARKPDPADFNEIYPGNREWVYAPVWKMSDQIFDPRDDSTGWSDNWALCFAHEMQTYFGLTMDDGNIAEEADISDEQVTNKESQLQARWTLNGVFSDDMPLETILGQCAAAADAFIWEHTDGTLRFKVGRWQEPTVILTLADFIGSLSITEGQADTNAVNEYAPEYIEPGREWKETPGGVIVVDPNGRRDRRSPQLFLVNNHNQAARATERIKTKDHAQYRLRGTLKLIGYELFEQDCGPRFARFQDAGFDFYLEMDKISARDDGVSFDIEARSVLPDDFAFTAATDEPDRPDYVDFDDAPDDDQLTGLAVENYGSGSIDPSLRWYWPAQDEIYRIGFQYRRVTTPAQAWNTISLPSGTTEYITTGLIEDETYEGQAVLLKGAFAEQTGDWDPDPALSIVAGSAPPALTVSTQAAEPGGVRFTGTAPVWTKLAGVKIYRAAVGAAFSTAVEVSGGTIAVASGASFNVFAGDDTVSNLIANGTFDSGSNWSLDANWSISGGVASHVAGADTADQTIAGLSAGVDYRYTFDILNRTGGAAQARIVGSSTASGSSESSDGTHQGVITAPASPVEFQMFGNASFVGDVDNIFLVEDTAGSLAQGEADFWIAPISDTGVRGTPDGPHTLRIP